jgi:hypothetical protein
MDGARTRRRGRIAALGDVCDEDGNVLILARMELERIVEDGVSTPATSRTEPAEAARRKPFRT